MNKLSEEEVLAIFEDTGIEIGLVSRFTVQGQVAQLLKGADKLQDAASDRLTLVQDCLNAYGSAMRGDWSMIDGRVVRDDLAWIACLLSDDTVDFKQALQRLGIKKGEYGYSWE